MPKPQQAYIPGTPVCSRTWVHIVIILTDSLGIDTKLPVEAHIVPHFSGELLLGVDNLRLVGLNII
jgi:hypothetical protein